MAFRTENTLKGESLLPPGRRRWMHICCICFGGCFWRSWADIGSSPLSSQWSALSSLWPEISSDLEKKGNPIFNLQPVSIVQPQLTMAGNKLDKYFLPKHDDIRDQLVYYVPVWVTELISAWIWLTTTTLEQFSKGTFYMIACVWINVCPTGSACTNLNHSANLIHRSNVNHFELTAFHHEPDDPGHIEHDCLEHEEDGNPLVVAVVGGVGVVGRAGAVALKVGGDVEGGVHPAVALQDLVRNAPSWLKG